jgi:ABC-type polysaccharide/polyol phosphate transport system ATPase subunit
VLLIGSVMGLSLRDIRRDMDEILAFAELERFANLKLKHYSSGMSERLGYAVAFKAVREVLVLDEIFAVGDAGFKARCEQRYWELRRLGHSAIIVSHNTRIIAEFCDRALLLDSGRVVLDAPAKEVAHRYVSSLTEGVA